MIDGWLLSGTILFLIGACIGSFLNVVIYRLPRNKSLLSPPSFCPRCGTTIWVRDNLPILGWIFLRGRARCCGEKISSRYPAIEFLTAALWGITGMVFAESSFSPTIAAGLLTAKLVFIAILVAVTFIDLDEQIIPDEISLGGLILAIIAAGLLPEMHFYALQKYPAVSPRLTAVIMASGGAIIGAAITLLVSFFGALIARQTFLKVERENPGLTGALGWGDVKLMAFFGAFFGALPAVIIFMTAAILGAGGGFIHRRLHGNDLIPFAPYLCSAALAWLFAAPTLTAIFSALLHFQLPLVY